MSFWNDLIIGEGNKGNSAVTLRKCGNVYISHNHVSYWVSGAYLGVGITIFKDTNDGLALHSMLADKWEDGTIEEWFTHLVLTKTPPDRLKACIEGAIERAFSEGRTFQAERIRTALQGG